MATNNNSATIGASQSPPAPQVNATDAFKYCIIDARHCGSGKLSYWEVMLECVIKSPGDIFVEHIFITLAPSTVNPGGICYIVRDENNIGERKRFRLNYREIDLDALPLLDDIGEIYRKELWDLVAFHETMAKDHPEVLFVAPLLAIIDKHRILRGLTSLLSREETKKDDSAPTPKDE